MTEYERFIFEDGKIKVRHDQADFTRDATAEEVWAYIRKLEEVEREWQDHYCECDCDD